MKKFSMLMLFILVGAILIFSKCNQGPAGGTSTPKDTTNVQGDAVAYGGFDSKVAWGKHLVTISGCNDCHTPKKMGPKGPEDNLDLLLSGHPANVPIPDINRKEIESKGLAAFGGTFTVYIGPWGVSFAANITSDSTTGIGTWTEEQFIRTFKTGKYGGAPDGRNLLPPMPFQNVAQMTDDELKAVYAYLESTKPVHNIVPQPLPPVLAMKK
ncbi:MAG: c-type cytochrome [Bacteroidetes bacterium]|nr:c-type cytochrome [Bacteroidota bacterium]